MCVDKAGQVALAGRTNQLPFPLRQFEPTRTQKASCLPLPRTGCNSMRLKTRRAGNNANDSKSRRKVSRQLPAKVEGPDFRRGIYAILDQRRDACRKACTHIVRGKRALMPPKTAMSREGC